MYLNQIILLIEQMLCYDWLVMIFFFIIKLLLNQLIQYYEKQH